MLEWNIRVKYHHLDDHHQVAKVTPNHPSIINWRNSITERSLIFTIEVAVWFLPSNTNCNLIDCFFCFKIFCYRLIAKFTGRSYRNGTPSYISTKHQWCMWTGLICRDWFRSLNDIKLPVLNSGDDAAVYLLILISLRAYCDLDFRKCQSYRILQSEQVNPGLLSTKAGLIKSYQCGSYLETLRVQHPNFTAGNFFLCKLTNPGYLQRRQPVYPVDRAPWIQGQRHRYFR